jgi:mono/diheme cytochrome c family protein
MPVIDKAPIQLTDDEILTVIAYLQSLGGTPSVTMKTRHAYNGGEGVDSLELANADVVHDAAAADGKAIFERYGCAECHTTTAPVGQRLDRAAILASILDPHNVKALSEDDVMKKRHAMEDAGVYDKATLREIELIVDFLVEQQAKK